MFKSMKSLLVVVMVGLLSCAPLAGQDDTPQSLPISATWSGDFPVAAFDRLPVGQRQNRVGYCSDAATFARMWRSFRPGKEVPAVDFTSDLVVFTRNVDFYNRVNILKVTLTRGVIDILAMETMSARPIEDQVAMAMAVVPRAGIKALRLDQAVTLPVESR